MSGHIFHQAKGSIAQNVMGLIAIAAAKPQTHAKKICGVQLPQFPECLAVMACDALQKLTLMGFWG